MKKNIQKPEIGKKKYQKGEIFVKVMAGVLAIMMMAGTIITLIYALI